jgi:cytochrome c553
MSIAPFLQLAVLPGSSNGERQPGRRRSPGSRAGPHALRFRRCPAVRLADGARIAFLPPRGHTWIMRTRTRFDPHDRKPSMKNATFCLFAIGMAAATGWVSAATKTVAPSPTMSATALAKEVCATCHGATGTTTVANVPNLAAQQEEYLAGQLKVLKTRSRSGPNAAANMWPVAHSLNDKQIEGLAKYFAAQKPQLQPVEGKPDQIAAGKSIATGGALANGIPPCSGCHGADGAGKTNYPRLAGQHMDYLVKQLTVLQTTNQRPDDPVMKSVSHNLSPENIANLAAYFQALPHESKAP